MKKTLSFYRADMSTRQLIPIYEGGIKAGFPSPAQDYLELSIDLNEEIIKHPATTFLARVSGDSMKEAGIYDGDILVIDKSLEPQSGAVAVCFIDGEFTVKYIRIEKDIIWLMPANEKYTPIKVTKDNDFVIWGIVTYSIKKHMVKRF